MPWLLLPGGNCPLMSAPPASPSATAPPTSFHFGSGRCTTCDVIPLPLAPQGQPVPSAVAAGDLIGILGQTRTVSAGPGSQNGAPGGQGGTPGNRGSQGGTPGNPGSQGGTPGNPGSQGGTPGNPGSQGGTPGNPGSQGGTPGNPGSQGGTPGNPGSQGGTPGSRRVPLGELVSVNLELVGLRGQPILLSWSIFQEGSQANLFGKWLSDFASYRLEATTNDDTGTLEMWIPLPKQHGPFFIHLSLTTDGVGLASADSGPFG